MRILTKLSEIQREMIRGIMGAAEPFTGVHCKVYYPVENTNVYKEENNSWAYEERPDIDQDLLVLGIYGVRNESENTLEGYSQDAMAALIISDDLRIPRNSKVEIFLGDKVLVYRAYQILPYYGEGVVLYQRIPLIPLDQPSRS